MPRAPRSLIGRYFHSFHPQTAHPDAPEPLVNWQGRVLDHCDEGYRVGLFSWLTGEMNTIKTVSAEEMSDWRFYRSGTAMCRWYDAYEERSAPYFKGKAERAGKNGTLRWYTGINGKS
jgi:hypothetical protein